MICIKCKKESLDAPFCCFCGAKQERSAPVRKRINGSGTVTKRGKTWQVKLSGTSYRQKQPDGTAKLVRRRPTKGGFRTKSEALEYLAQANYNGLKSCPNLQKLWEGYSENDMKKLSDSKICAYKKARERLEPIIGRRIDDLTLDDLQACVNRQATSYYTARDMKSVLSKLYQRAMVNRLIDVNLAKFLILPDLEEKEPEPFTADEVASMWTAWDEGNVFSGYLLLMVYAGMMPGELFSCKKSMVNFDLCEIYGCGRKTKKRKETPIVYPTFLSAVIGQLAEAAPGEKLLPYDPNTFYEKYHKTTAEIGIRDLPPYSCRHTTATAAVRKGVELPIVQQLMRHSKIASTMRYVHVASAETHAAVNSFDCPSL